MIASSRQPRNRRLTDVVAASDAALRLALRHPHPCFLLLMRCELRLAPEFDATFLGLGSASCRPLEDAAAFELGRNPADCEDDPAKSDVVARNGSASDLMPAPARCISRAMTSRSVVSRDSRSTTGVITTSPGLRAAISFLSWGRATVVPVTFSRKILAHPAALS